MATTAPKAKERLEVRVSSEIKEMIEYAADLRGETITAFATRALAKEAEEAITSHSIIKLTMEESREFLRALSEGSEPNEELKRAAKDYWSWVAGVERE